MMQRVHSGICWNSALLNIVSITYPNIQIVFPAGCLEMWSSTEGWSSPWFLLAWRSNVESVCQQSVQKLVGSSVSFLTETQQFDIPFLLHSRRLTPGEYLECPRSHHSWLNESQLKSHQMKACLPAGICLLTPFIRSELLFRAVRSDDLFLPSCFDLPAFLLIV